MRGVGSLVVAGFAAGLAIHQAVGADANVELRLTEAAELIADALVFRHFTLAAAVLAVAGSGVHANNVALLGTGGNVPLVTGGAGVRAYRAAEAAFNFCWTYGILRLRSGRLEVVPFPIGYAKCTVSSEVIPRSPCHIILSNDLPTGAGWSGSPRAKRGSGRDECGI